MIGPRIVNEELLDGLAAGDPAAIRSRRDLRRVHRLMGTRGIVARRLEAATSLSRRSALKVLELGAGDGTLMLGVARSLRPRLAAVELTLLDRLMIVDQRTVASYAKLGWSAVPLVADVLEWAARGAHDPAQAPPTARWDVIIANLFLHHFADTQLAGLLGAIARCTDHFLACEPRRGALAIVGSHLLGAIGASAVTRTDAVLSVRAGFRSHELQAHWPAGCEEWAIDESPARLFTHVFYAERAVRRRQ